MRSDHLKKVLRFCCIIDDADGGPSLRAQAETALKAGATLIRYNAGNFSSEISKELQALCRLCQSNGVPFMIRDHLLLAGSLGADGLHIENSVETAETVRSVLGPGAIFGGHVSPKRAGFPTGCDYIEFESFDSGASRNASPAFAIAGNIQTPEAARKAFDRGATGITVRDTVIQSGEPAPLLTAIGGVCRCAPRTEPEPPWGDEFGLIRKILKQAPRTRSGLIVPPGDDACLLSSLPHPVISTDTQKEGVHFRLDWQSPEEIGGKAVSITLSDLAASYAQPVSLFVNLSMPPRISDRFVEALYSGIRNSLERYNCGLGGGNISSGKELSLDLFAVGNGRDDIFPRRSAAQEGFDLYVTGPLGMARTGLEALRKDDGEFPELVKRFKYPRARFDAAEVLAAHGVTCVMDISDGLSGDAAHMAEASELTIELDSADLAHPEALIAFCRKYDQSPDAFAIAGGEDYELLFACQPEMFPDIRAELPEAARVGRCLPFQGRRIISQDIKFASYRHGA
jgi:thiamine-monophosphate kinase